MHSPRKRHRASSGSDVVLEPQHINRRRVDLQTQLKTRFEQIFEKYERDFTGIGDEVDITTGEVVVDNGHLVAMHNEHDVVAAACVKADDNDSHLQRGSPPEHDHVLMILDSESDEASIDSRCELDSLLGDTSEQAAIGDHGNNAAPMASAVAGKDVFRSGIRSVIDPKWDAPEIPGLRPLKADIDVTKQRSSNDFARSTSPEVSVWDVEQPDNLSGYVRKRHETPWNSKNNNLLLQLRKTTKLTYPQLQQYFPGRSASTIRSHWQTLDGRYCHQDRRGRAEMILELGSSHDTSESISKSVDEPSTAVEAAQRRKKDMCTEPSSAAPLELCSHENVAEHIVVDSSPSTKRSPRQTNNDPSDYDQKPKEGIDNQRPGSPARRRCLDQKWMLDNHDTEWTTEQDLQFMTLINKHQVLSQPQKRRSAAIENVIDAIHTLLDPRERKVSLQDQEFRTRAKQRLSQICRKMLSEQPQHSKPEAVTTKDLEEMPCVQIVPTSLKNRLRQPSTTLTTAVAPAVVTTTPAMSMSIHSELGNMDTPDSDESCKHRARRIFDQPACMATPSSHTKLPVAHQVEASVIRSMPSTSQIDDKIVNSEQTYSCSTSNQSSQTSSVRTQYDLPEIATSLEGSKARKRVSSPTPSKQLLTPSTPRPLNAKSPRSRPGGRGSRQGSKAKEKRSSKSQSRTERSSQRVSFISMVSDDSEDELGQPSAISTSREWTLNSKRKRSLEALRLPSCSMSSPLCQRKFCVRCSLMEDDELAGPILAPNFKARAK